MIRLFGVLLALVLAVPALTAQQQPAATPKPLSERPLVAVLEFDYGAVKQQWAGITISIGKVKTPVDVSAVGDGVADLVMNAMLESGQVRVLERKRIAEILAEQDLAKGERADPTAKDTAKTQKVLGARYFITGAVTRFSGEQKNKGGGGIIGGPIGAILGGIGLKNTKAYVDLTARVIDSSTSEVLATAKGSGVSKRKGVLIGGGGANAGGGGAGVFGFGSSDFEQTILGEATVIAVKELCAGLQAQISALGR